MLFSGKTIAVNYLAPFLLTSLLLPFLSKSYGRIVNVYIFFGRKAGADAIIYLATSDGLNNVSGKYFNQKQGARADDQAYDEDARSKLWGLSENYTNVNFVLSFPSP